MTSVGVRASTNCVMFDTFCVFIITCVSCHYCNRYVIIFVFCDTHGCITETFAVMPGGYKK